MIPKIIHYVWLGGKSIPNHLQQFIDGWKKKMPDYKIVRWDESNFPISEHPFVQEAIKNKRWAFAADYIRIYALMNMGGIYMDTDVKVLRRFDEFLNHSFFTSYENHYSNFEYKFLYGRYINKDGTKIKGVRCIPGVGLMSAVIGSEKGGTLISEMYQFYHSQKYYNKDGSDFCVLAPWMQSYCAEKFGLKYLDIKQELADRIVIYPSYVFTVNTGKITTNSVTIHVENAAWIKGGNKYRRMLAKIPTVQTIYRVFHLIFKAHYYRSDINEGLI